VPDRYIDIGSLTASIKDTNALLTADENSEQRRTNKLVACLCTELATQLETREKATDKNNQCAYDKPESVAAKESTSNIDALKTELDKLKCKPVGTYLSNRNHLACLQRATRSCWRSTTRWNSSWKNTRVIYIVYKCINRENNTSKCGVLYAQWMLKAARHWNPPQGDATAGAVVWLIKDFHRLIIKINRRLRGRRNVLPHYRQHNHNRHKHYCRQHLIRRRHSGRKVYERIPITNEMFPTVVPKKTGNTTAE